MEDTNPLPYRLFSTSGTSEVVAPLAQEWPLAIRLNGRELVTLLCTPFQLDRLVVGYLFSEGLVDSADEIVLMGLCPDDGTADVWLEDERRILVGPRILTSGCGKGATYTLKPSLSRLDSPMRVSPAMVYRLMRKMLAAARMYPESGGLHTAALGREGSILALSEDVGRHNTVDKIIGECLMGGLSTDGAILLATGRISSEMVTKAARARMAVAASLSAPTDRAVRLAEELGITLIGYVRGHTMRVYSHAGRVDE